jgi:hypothetical protein
VIRLQIGSDERVDDSISESWVNQQVGRRRADGAPVCARVSLKTDSVDFSLSTAGCRGRGGAPLASFSATEQKIIELWGKCGLNEEDFQGGQLIAFLKQVRRLL